MEIVVISYDSIVFISFSAEEMKFYEEKFRSLVSATLKETEKLSETYGEKEITSQLFVNITNSLLIDIKHGGCIDQYLDGKSIRSMFLTLKKCWSFIHYSLLEYIISDLGFASTTLQEDMRLYTEDINQFMERTTVKKLLERYPCGDIQHSNAHQVRIGVDRNSSEWTLKHVMELKEKICSNMLLSDCAMTLACMEEGSVWTTWYVSDSLAYQIAAAVHSYRGSFFEMNRVLKLELDGISLYQSTTSG